LRSVCGKKNLRVFGLESRARLRDAIELNHSSREKRSENKKCFFMISENRGKEEGRMSVLTVRAREKYEFTDTFKMSVY
jgi:hypothetical protein